MLCEVGPRDGLQNEAATISAGDKIALIDALSAAGLREIEATSFVSPAWVPQLADAAEVMAGITRAPGARYTALTPNETGYDRARAAGVDRVAVFAAASETFSQKNINCSIAESLDRFVPVFSRAAADGLPVRGYISCVTDCPYEGAIAPAAVAHVAAALRDAGAEEISLGDTIGRGSPAAVAAMLEAVLAQVPAARLAGHFHDTGGRAVDNIAVAYDAGLRVFDTAVAGLGGCPYAPGAAGNVATEAVVAHFAARGVETGVDADALAEAADLARRLSGRAAHV
ncbi:MAG: hydroxymethylglutaryl-CoA lyase [Pseudomonadota bacterium]